MDSALKAECACVRADALDAFVAATDELIAKSLAVSEVAQIARLELRSREMLLAKWSIRSAQAADTAGRIVANGGTLASASKAATAAMAKWKGDVSGPYTRNVAMAYRLARVAGHKRATGKYKKPLHYAIQERLVEKAKKPTAQIKFDLVDVKAVQALQKQEMIWVGGVYDGVAPVVRDALKPAILAGLSDADAGKRVAEALRTGLKGIAVPDGFNGSASKYFEGLAANAITNARVQGQLISFSKLSITQYEIVNPMDDRTTLICREMNGQVFYVKDAMAQIADIQDADSPEEYKKAHPWVSASKIIGLKSSGYGALVKAGQCFPPYHFACRSTVDISESSSTLG